MKLSGIVTIHRASMLDNGTVALNASYQVGKDKESGEKVYDNLSIYCNEGSSKSARYFAKNCLTRLSNNDATYLTVWAETYDTGSTVSDGKYVNRNANLISGHFVDTSSNESSSTNGDSE